MFGPALAVRFVRSERGLSGNHQTTPSAVALHVLLERVGSSGDPSPYENDRDPVVSRLARPPAGTAVTVESRARPEK